MRGLARRTFAFYWGQGIADDVPALTYYLVLSLAPVALGLAALQALLLSDVQSALSVVDTLNRFLPDAVHGDIRQLVLGIGLAELERPKQPDRMLRVDDARALCSDPAKDSAGSTPS